MLHSKMIRILKVGQCLSTHARRTRHGTSCTLYFTRWYSDHKTVPATGFVDYEKERKNFSWDVPKHFNFAENVIDSWAKQEKTGYSKRTKPAFWWVDDRGNELKWTFSELCSFSKRVAYMLQGPCGVLPKERVMVILPRVPQWWLINIACARTGAVLIPGTTLLTSDDIRDRVQRSQTKCIITDGPNAEKVDQIVKDCPSLESRMVVDDGAFCRKGWHNFLELFETSPSDFTNVKTEGDDPMTIFFTSGTTGKAKMAEHSHGYYGPAHLLAGKYWMDLVPEDIHWNLSDTGWAKSAWSSLLAPWIQGACVFVHHTTGFNPEKTLGMLEKYPITTFCSAPTAYRMMVQENLSKYSFSFLRHCISAGEPLNPEVVDTWLGATGLTIREGYGQSETALLSASYRCIPNKPGSMGKPAPGMDTRIIDENGKETADNVEGDIAVKAKPHKPIGLFMRYVDDPKRTEESFRGDFYLTGDRGIRDEDGYLFFVGRSDDVINSAGYRIGPFEVESALIEHPAVLESAVVSSPDAIRGEIVKAFVVLTDQYKSAGTDDLVREIQDHVKRTTAPYKYPRKIEFVNELPKTVSGKIRRVELRNKEWSTSKI